MYFEVDLQRLKEQPIGLDLSTENTGETGVLIEAVHESGQAWQEYRSRTEKQESEIDMDEFDQRERRLNKEKLVQLRAGCRVTSISDKRISSKQEFEYELDRHRRNGDPVCYIYWKDPSRRRYENEFLTRLCCHAVESLSSIFLAAEASGALSLDAPDRSASLVGIYNIIKNKASDRFRGIPESFQQIGVGFLRLYNDSEGADAVEIADVRTNLRGKHNLPKPEVRDLFEMFTAVVAKGPKDRIKQRKYELINMLENAEHVSTAKRNTTGTGNAATDADGASQEGTRRASLLGQNISAIFSSSGESGNIAAWGNIIDGEKDRAGEEINRGHHMVYIKITWDDLVLRMESYVRNHLFAPTKTCTDIIDILRCHLLKVRDFDGSLKEVGELNESQLQQFVECQNNLNRHGVATLMAEILTTNRVGMDGDFADMAVELLAEMLQGGNKEVQQSIFIFVTTKDPKGAFLSHIKDRLERAERAVRERKDAVRVKYSPFTDGLSKEYDEMIQTFTFMQLLCEGHSLHMQNLVRSQEIHGSAVSINLLLHAIRIFTLQVESAAILRRFDEKDVEAAESCLNFLIEALQGPCPENQHFVVKHTSPAPAVEACKQILPSQLHARCSKESRLRFQGSAVKLLAACLEGRTDLVCHLELAGLIEPDMIRSFRQALVKRHEEIETESSRTGRRSFALTGTVAVEDLFKTEDISKPNADEEKRRCLDDVVAVLVDLQSVTHELESIDAFITNDPFHSPALQRDPQKMKESRVQHLQDMQFVNDKIGKVEIFWNGRTESVCFPLPLTHRCLQASSRQAFLNSVDLSTTEKRMKELVNKVRK